MENKKVIDILSDDIIGIKKSIISSIIGAAWKIMSTMILCSFTLGVVITTKLNDINTEIKRVDSKYDLRTTENKLNIENLKGNMKMASLDNLRTSPQ